VVNRGLRALGERSVDKHQGGGRSFHLGLGQITEKGGEVLLGASVTLSQLQSRGELYADGALGCLPDALHDLGLSRSETWRPWLEL